MWADSLYVRDQWQVNRVLTVSLGLRGDDRLFGPGETGGFETYNFQTNTMYLCGSGAASLDGLRC